jgi:hypothetical protein
MNPYWRNVSYTMTQLCLELNISIEIKYITIYKLYLGYTEKLYKYAEFVPIIEKYVKNYFKKLLKLFKIITNYVCQVLNFPDYSVQGSIKRHHCTVCGCMLLGVNIVTGHSAQG